MMPTDCTFQLAPIVKFGTDMPEAPIQGEMWWNGTVLGLFDGAIWSNVHTGAEIPIPPIP